MTALVAAVQLNNTLLAGRYEALFRQTDNDKDGYVSGVEIKNLFLQTGLPQNILAHIW